MFRKNKQKINFLTVCVIFFELKFSKFIQNIRTLERFGKFLLIVIALETILKTWKKCKSSSS